MGEEVNQGAVMAFGGDGQDTLNVSGVAGLLKGDVLEEGADPGKTEITGTSAIVSVFFTMIEESADERRVEIVQRELGREFVELPLGEPEKQPEGVAVRGDGVRTGLSLTDEAVGEKGLQQGC
jgi:hypothetical protein